MTAGGQRATLSRTEAVAISTPSARVRACLPNERQAAVGKAVGYCGFQGAVKAGSEEGGATATVPNAQLNYVSTKQQKKNKSTNKIKRHKGLSLSLKARFVLLCGTGHLGLFLLPLVAVVWYLLDYTALVPLYFALWKERTKLVLTPLFARLLAQRQSMRLPSLLRHVVGLPLGAVVVAFLCVVQQLLS